jgi:cell division protein FtsW
MGTISEELGFVFTLLFLFVPYLFVLFRGLTIAHRAPDAFSALVAIGCIVMINIQALINMSVAVNLLPCTGVPLPFISYGGTSLIASMMMAGLLLNVSGLRGPQQHRPIPLDAQSITG